MIVVVLIEATENGVSLLANEDNKMIMGFKTIQDGLDYFEKAYRIWHRRSYESSMSVLLNSITFRPSITTFNDIEDLTNKLFNGEKEGLQLISLNHVSGRMLVFKIFNQENARMLWDAGLKPSLI